MRTMLAHGKLINIRDSDDGLVAEVQLDTMTPELIEAALGAVTVELTLPDGTRVGARPELAMIQAVQDAHESD